MKNVIANNLYFVLLIAIGMGCESKPKEPVYKFTIKDVDSSRAVEVVKYYLKREDLHPQYTPSGFRIFLISEKDFWKSQEGLVKMECPDKSNALSNTAKLASDTISIIAVAHFPGTITHTVYLTGDYKILEFKCDTL